jgi:hypothetical protein
MKVLLIALGFVVIIGALASAGVAMLRGPDRSKPGAMARALAIRVGASVLLFVCILGAYKLGWIEPTGLPIGK